MKVAYEQGRADAVDHFGLCRSTLKPPDPWSKDWQQEPVKGVPRKRVTIPSMTARYIREQVR